jgi:WD40 repeat protein
MAASIELELFSESSLSNPVTAKLLACNPTVDLLATASDTNALNIWRARGQLVARHVERNHKIQSLRWKPDGKTLTSPTSLNIAITASLTLCRTIPGSRLERRSLEARRV